MKDGLLRRIVKRIALLRYTVDLGITRRLRGAPHFVLRGTCGGCGRCCETPSIPVRPLFFRLRLTRWIILEWHRLVNGFEYVDEDRKRRLLVFHCTHFDAVTRRCDAYESRPGLCRDYPRNLLYSSKPDLFPECGFYALHRNAAGFRDALERLDLPPEKLAELKEKLHLRERDSS
jgi:Fe-S-cluster containining protein